MKKITKNIRMHVLSVLLLTGLLSSTAQTVAVKTNLLYDIALVPSLGLEVMLSKRLSANLFGSYMPIKQSVDHYWRTYSVQPEVRYWPVVPLAGPFVGAAYQYRGYNLGGLPFSHLKDSRSQGHMQGGGLTLGWHHILSTRWSLEASLLVGWTHLHWNHYATPTSKEVLTKWRANYIGPLDLGLNIVYIIK